MKTTLNNRIGILFFGITIFSALIFAESTKNSLRKFAIMDLKNGNGVTTGESEIITDRLRIEIFNTGKATIMERNQMNAIMQEQGFQMSGVCSDDGCMVEVGQLLGVERLIGGSIGKLGSMYLLNFRVIDVSTAQILSVVSLDIKGSIETVVYKLSEIAWQLTSDNKKSQSALTVTDRAEVKQTVVKKEVPNSPNGIEQVVYSNDVDGIECNSELILYRTMDFGTVLSFAVKEETRNEIDKDLVESLEGFLEDNVDKDLDIVVVTEGQIANLPADCNSKVVRSVLRSYSEVDGVGKATTTFYFFKDTKTNKYSLKVDVTDSGSSSDDEQTRIMNTFENLEDMLEENLDDFDDEIQMMDPAR